MMLRKIKNTLKKIFCVLKIERHNIIIKREINQFKLSKDIDKIKLSLIDYIYNQEKSKYSETIDKILAFDPNLVTFIAEEERAFPGDKNFMETGHTNVMLKRYFFAGKMFCENKSVLDSCCGIGWGSKILSNYAEKLTSFDIEKKAIEFSNKYWNVKNTRFIEGDALDSNFLKDEKFDAVTAFETIEHFSKENGEKYILEMSKVLKDNGILIGTSYFPETNEKAKEIRLTNPYHLHIFTEIELEKILKLYFKKFHIIDRWMFIAIK